ncbi:MAG: SET domain-containing protein-lysine N-methyltransferase [Nanoarchaeales archaeon]|nr:SET domain-containing protein-lysine N-methyltransferase [Nanoarchaeales archaeon]
MKFVEIRKSKINGTGVFALRNFLKKEIILFLDGEIWKKKNYEEYDENLDPRGGPISRCDKYNYFLKSNSSWVYINHNCDSNSGLINDKTLVAKRDIKKGEEITQDYSTLDIEAIKGGKKRLDMECECGSTKCRRIITSFDLLDEKIKCELITYVNSAVIKLYDLK